MARSTSGSDAAASNGVAAGGSAIDDLHAQRLHRSSVSLPATHRRSPESARAARRRRVALPRTIRPQRFHPPTAPSGDAPTTDRSVACWHRNAYRQGGRNGCREARPLRGRRHPQRVAITPPTFPLAVAPPERRARRARWGWGGEISGQGAITAREKPRGRPRRTPCTQSCWNSSPLSGLRPCSETQTTRGGQVRRAARGGHDHPGTRRGPACRALSPNPGESQQTPRPLPSRPPTGTALPRTRPSDSQMSSPSTDQQHRGRAPCRAYLHRGRCGTDAHQTRSHQVFLHTSCRLADSTPTGGHRARQPGAHRSATSCRVGRERFHRCGHFWVMPVRNAGSYRLRRTIRSRTPEVRNVSSPAPLPAG